MEGLDDPFMTFPLVTSDAFWIDRVSVQRKSIIGKVFVNKSVPYSLDWSRYRDDTGNGRLSPVMRLILPATDPDIL
jgi:hypothetical protein